MNSELTLPRNKLLVKLNIIFEIIDARRSFRDIMTVFLHLLSPKFNSLQNFTLESYVHFLEKVYGSLDLQFRNGRVPCSERFVPICNSLA